MLLFFLLSQLVALFKPSNLYLHAVVLYYTKISSKHIVFKIAYLFTFDVVSSCLHKVGTYSAGIISYSCYLCMLLSKFDQEI